MSNSPAIELPPAAPPSPPPADHRRRRRIALIAGAAALVLAVPPTLYLTLRTESGHSTAAVPSTSPQATMTSSPTATAAPTGTPAAPPGATTAPATPAPDGRITLATLKNATLDIPAWPNDDVPGLAGPVKFTDGKVYIPADTAYPAGRFMVIERIVYGDVDRDGAQETVASIGAYIQGGSQQLIAFDRDRSGRIITLGAVAATTGPVRSIDASSYSVAANGVVTARVADYQGCCGDRTPTLWQWRSYGWNGQRFHQAGGPTAFPDNPNVTETSLASSGLVLGPVVDGARHGVLTVTVAYLYGTVPDHLSIRFYTALQRDGSAWPPVYAVTNGFAVDVPTPALGATKTYTFAFSGPVNSAGQDFRLNVGGSDKSDGALLSEANPYNSYLQTTIRTSD